MVTVDAGTLATIASIISAFGAAMLFFRIQRELEMAKEKEVIWLPVADWLLVAATLLSLVFVILPIVYFSSLRILFPAAACGAAVILVAGYVFAILAHYRILFSHRYVFFGKRRSGARGNPEPSELIISLATVILAIVFVIW